MEAFTILTLFCTNKNNGIIKVRPSGSLSRYATALIIMGDFIRFLGKLWGTRKNLVGRLPLESIVDYLRLA